MSSQVNITVVLPKKEGEVRYYSGLTSITGSPSLGTICRATLLGTVVWGLKKEDSAS